MIKNFGEKVRGPKSHIISYAAYASVEALRYLLHYLLFLGQKTLYRFIRNIQSNRQFFGLGLVPIKNRLTIDGLDKRL